MKIKNYDVNYPGVSIKAKVFFDGDIRSVSGVILCLHGFGGHKDSKAIDRFAEFVMSKYKKIAVVAFDLPAHGNDVRKKLTLSDCDSYISLMLDDIKKRYSTEEIYAYATSFGGYLVLKYIHEHGSAFSRIALRCPAIKMHEVINHSIMNNDSKELLEFGRDAKLGFDRLITVSPSFIEDLMNNQLFSFDYLEFAENIFICHGSKDEIVPIQDSIDFCDNNVIEFSEIKNADHRFHDRTLMDLAINQTAKFLLQ